MKPESASSNTHPHATALGKAFKEFVSNTVSWSVGFTALDFVWKRAFYKLPFNQDVGARIKQSLPLTLTISAAFSVWDGIKAYRHTLAAEKEHAELQQENQTLHRQLDITTAALSQVVLQTVGQQTTPGAAPANVRYVFRVNTPADSHAEQAAQDAQTRAAAAVQIT